MDISVCPLHDKLVGRAFDEMGLSCEDAPERVVTLTPS